ncbi:uncharacterized protein LOC143847202 isoform X3 [Tasmannia lanceolata]|uniref:uncharacterized protein LOC143847202 isoform X2 n=1 Tax=Tasmannia lanceolata TaxID=3420 RepID=UPI004064C02A
MACHVIHTWTFPTLIGAFLDLALAYLLLCGSALAFFASKFLGFFGLYLPCPCNGLFGDPNNNESTCLQRFLVDRPAGKISAVQMSVKTKFPFDSIWMNHFNVKLLRDKTSDGVLQVEMEKEGEESFTGSSSKGKGVLNQKPMYGVRRRKKSSGVLSRGSAPRTGVVTETLYGGADQKEEVVCEARSFGVNSGGNLLQYGVAEGSTGIGLVAGDPPAVESNGLLGGNIIADRDTSFIEELVRSARDSKPGIEGSDANTIRVLEQALEEEHAACVALYLELEKERNAAATAADEAMAMILRLQKEKASIEMEARQYQRMIEEKSAYDEEEMNILKEILLRREREKHVLEKEVEAYRNMMISGEKNQQSDDGLNDVVDLSRQRNFSSFDSTDNPVLMLQQISESIRKKELMKDMNMYSEENQSSSYVRGKESESHVPECMDDCNLEFQEKGVVSMYEYPSVPEFLLGLENDAVLSKLNESQAHKLHGKTDNLVDEYKDHTRIHQAATQSGDQTHSGTETSFLCGGSNKYAGQRGTDSQISQLEMDLNVHDVHVVDDKFKICNKGTGKESEVLLKDSASNGSHKCVLPFETSGVSKVDVLYNHSSTSMEEYEPNIHRSSSDTTTGFLVPGSSRGNSYLRWNSLSAVDNERLKLETEVGWLRERLKIVQEGKEKLSFALGHRESENFQLQLLEEIAGQLREIRSLTERGKALRRVSLPPPSSKVRC